MSGHCKAVARLFSESLDHRLPLRKRILLWIHLAMCGICRGFAHDQRLLRQYLQSRGDDSLKGELSEEARERLKKILRAES